MTQPPYIVARQFSEPSDMRGLIQCLGVLAVAATTGTFTLLAWRWHYPWIALVGLIAHGNVCSLFVNAVHEMAHRRVFKTDWLHDLFGAIFGFLNWMDVKDYWATHRGHHVETLTPLDPELAGACRPIGWWTIVGSCFFNMPKFVASWLSTFRSPVKNGGWIFLSHEILFFITCFNGGWREWLILVTLAPFWFNWAELLLNYPQHAGLEVESDHAHRHDCGIVETGHIHNCDCGANKMIPLSEKVRSLRLPRWLSFLNWYMECHYEHHAYPSVPCYRLRELSEALGTKTETLWEAWRFIFKSRTPGRCGHGESPLRKLWR